ncbi:UBN2_3 domain-containing protein [Gossypium australe]|uniref:UBN2_3 domain-containing protein n=1 Tax=Gossypium australe TaxID=47621 RepID=A0A5B6U2Z1_9ROSI|nr:UBN2_3 domain-containing protein [Gossypium australe]
MVNPSKSTIDFNHPLYLHPSNTPGTLLVSHKLLGVENYNVWSRTMKIALLVKNKLGIVDGTCSKDLLLDEMGHQWERCYAIVLSWILNTVSKELSAGIVFAYSAVSVWNDLGERFHKIDGLRIYFLHREITSHLQGTTSISNVAHLLQQRLFQFLMGLNEKYTAVRSQILLMNLLPYVNHAYSMLVQEESQRQHSSNDVGSDPVSFH